MAERAPTDGKRTWPWAPALLALAVAAAYAGSLQGPFVFDDIPNIVDNPTIRSLWPPQRVLVPPADSGIASRPIVNLTLALNHALSGTAVWSYHLFNALVHLLAALTLFGVVRRTLLLPRAPERLRADAAPLALAVALLWALHPLQTQAVTYTIQRCESLMGLFFLLVFYCAIRGWSAPSSPRETDPPSSPDPAGRTGRMWRTGNAGQPRKAPTGTRGLWHGGAVAAFLLGAGAKEVILVAPPLLFLHELLFIRGSARAVWRASRGLHLGLAAGLLLAAALLAGASGRMVQPERAEVSALEYAATQPAVVLHYLRLALWPDALSFDYGWPVMPLSRTWPAAAFLGVLLALTAWTLARRRPVGFTGVWFFAVLAPSSSFVPLPDLAFEHRLYLPLAAPVALLVLGGHALLGRAKRGPAGSAARAAGVVLLALLALALGARTAARNRDYRSAVALWSDTVRRQPLNARARLSLGIALDEQGCGQEGLAQMTEAVRLHPRLVRARVNLAIALLEIGRAGEALEHLRAAVALDPREARARSHLGIALCQLGRLEEGVRELREALRLDPSRVEAHLNLSLALGELGQEGEARRHFEAAYRLDPRYVQSSVRP
ncbi:MAG: tetratricopeptide repeat protein [Candidatus Eisenbacteria bacterium]|uniref:Tetratricopeptide repeat protein n=1 Tax=Eiseniibacteriota bacterium TaxID=2212470 RepID=A0A937XBA7_UNCEI|nr:tetratricopeptide repeat protein [Candidatus Eisenbacteria bacterium]